MSARRAHSSACPQRRDQRQPWWRGRRRSGWRRRHGCGVDITTDERWARSAPSAACMRGRRDGQRCTSCGVWLRGCAVPGAGCTVLRRKSPKPTRGSMEVHLPSSSSRSYLKACGMPQVRRFPSNELVFTRVSTGTRRDRPRRRLAGQRVPRAAASRCPLAVARTTPDALACRVLSLTIPLYGPHPLQNLVTTDRACWCSQNEVRSEARSACV